MEWIFETYFDHDFTLKKLTTEAYIRDPRFEVHGAAIRWPDSSTRWYDAAELPQAFEQIDWENTAVLAHHAQFEGLILSHHYRRLPRAWLDTLPMARLLIGNHLSVGLASLAQHFNLNPKNVPYDLFRGKHWWELDGVVQADVANGCCHDIGLTWAVFNRLAHAFPIEEYAIVDTTIRMFTEPVLLGDIPALDELIRDEQHRKQTLLNLLEVSAKDIGSDETFAGMLREEGVEPEQKTTAKGNVKYAFAKTDAFMTELLDDADDTIRQLAEARIGNKSSIDETRAGRLAGMARRGALAVYLSAYGAHTTRWSGGDKLNWQNFKRRGAIRKAIRVPDGCTRIKADKSQIECRYLNMLAGQWDVIQRFATGADPYIGIASKAYGEEVYKPRKGDPREAEMEMKRGTGKQLELSCGYGAGADTIVHTAAKGTYGPPVYIDAAKGLEWRDLYRREHPAVCGHNGYWKQAEWALRRLAGGETFDWSLFHFEAGRVYLPNGCPLIYDGLEWHVTEDGDSYWRFRTRRGWAKLWGGSFTENLIQAIARVDMSQTLLRIQARAPGVKIANLEHDACIAITLDKYTSQAEKIIREEFVRPPSWCPDIPLACDVSIGSTYD